MTSLLRQIDVAVITALQHDPALRAHRMQLRGDGQQGLDITEGPVPSFDSEEGRFVDVVDGDTPQTFVVQTSVRLLDTGAVEYTVFPVLVLPAQAHGGDIPDDDFELFGQEFMRALLPSPDPLYRKSLDKLLADSTLASSALDYRVGRVSLRGPHLQPRVEAQIAFEIPASSLVGTNPGIVEA